jgi:hypothetical protein
MRGKRVNREENSLIAPLKLMALVQRTNGEAKHTHCRIYAGFIIATNSLFAAGAKLPDDLDACPHTHRLLAALETAPYKVSITKHSASLTVASKDFSAEIPCIDPSVLDTATPDTPAALVSEVLRDCLGKTAQCVGEVSESSITSSVLLRSGDCIATNNETVINAWHGFMFGEASAQWLIPRVALTAVIKHKSVLIKLGFNAEMQTITFWFDDDSWIKTFCFPVPYPDDVVQVFNQVPTEKLIPAPKAFAEDLEKLEPFAETKIVKFTGDYAKVQSLQGFDSAQIKCEFPPCAFNLTQLKLVLPYMEKFGLQNGILVAYKGNMRAAVIVRRENQQSQ